MRVVFAAARSAPGVTTAMLACASVWPGRVLVVEASEDGGALAARFGLPGEPGLTTLAAAIRHHPDPAALTAHLQPLPDTGGRIVGLLGPATVEVAQPLLRAVAPHLAVLLDAVSDATVLVGRRPAATVTGRQAAGRERRRLLLVVRPRVEELHTLAGRLAVLAGLGPAPELLVVGERPYGPDEIAETLGCPVAGVLADDRPAAEAWPGRPPPGGCGEAGWCARRRAWWTGSPTPPPCPPATPPRHRRWRLRPTRSPPDRRTDGKAMDTTLIDRLVREVGEQLTAAATANTTPAGRHCRSTTNGRWRRR